MAKKQFPKIVTPVGTASFPHIHKPDTEGKYADNKFKLSVYLDKNDPNVKEFIRTLEERCDEAARTEWGEVPKDLNYPLRDGDDITDEKKREYSAGNYILTGKSKFAPGIKGPDNNALPSGVEVRGGDSVRYSALLLPYESTEKVRDPKTKKLEVVTSYGITVQLRQVQLVEKRNGGGGASDFDAVGGPIQGYEDEEEGTNDNDQSGDSYDDI